MMTPRRLAFCFLLCAGGASAQVTVITPLPSSASAVVDQAGIPQVPATSDPSSIASVLPSDSPFEWPPFVLRPHYLYRFLYGNGIQARPGTSSTTAINTFSPGFLLEIGSHWTFDYTPTWDLYSNHAFRDTLGQALTLAGNYAYSDWTTQVRQTYAYSSEPLIETGIQTSEQDYNTVVDISHSFSQHILFEGNVLQSLRYAVGFPDSYTWSNTDWFHYRFAQSFDTAIGASLGYIHESQGADSEYATPEAQLSWKPTDKVTFDVTGGLEHRTFLSRPRSSLDTPTYTGSLAYAPIETTTVNFTAVRSLAPAYEADQTSRSTTVTAGLQQRLLKKLFLSGSIAHSDVDYLTTQASVATGRSDSQTSYNARLSTAFLRRGTISILYTESHNSSTVQGFEFTSHQVGMEIDYRY